MSAVDELRALLEGRRPAVAPLQNIRWETGGVEFYGEEAVLEQGRRAPLDLASAELVEAPAQLALFGDGVAAVADCFGPHVGRVWTVGVPAPADSEPSLAVAFDPDLQQARGSVFWAAADHPGAAPPLLERLAELGAELVEEAARDGARPAYRIRAWLIRAFGEPDRGVGLFALHRLGPGPVRSSRWSYAAILVSAGAPRIVRDPAEDAATLLHRL